MPEASSPPGRPRDTTIDAAILDAAARHLAANGYEAMSVVAIAEDAGTTRQALYRRWPSKADLATATIAHIARGVQRPDSDDPFADLVAELAAFHEGIGRPNGMSMVGSMLQQATDSDLASLYRSRVVAPRRRRLRHILQRGIDAGLLDPAADLESATAACTGIHYALALAGARIPKAWPERTARFVWAACGGAEPSSDAGRRG
ncbi:MAG: TetR/AcrR family transcriptional regulator [Actinomycetota bacterium]